jgi:3-mercaptopropionate dioxygenase
MTARFHRASGAGEAGMLEAFCLEVERIVMAGANEERCAAAIEPALRRLIARDDWLGAAWRRWDAAKYCQHLLYLDPHERFCVVSFVWAPGQSTPVHDHGVWGLVGVLQGVELSQPYRLDDDGGLQAIGDARRLAAGDTEMLLPSQGDMHRVRNDGAEIAISIHVYGADIGRHRRRALDARGNSVDFVSSYSTAVPALERCLSAS